MISAGPDSQFVAITGDAGEARDAFIEEPGPGLESWTLDETDCVYKAPTPPPPPLAVGDGTFRPYHWNEATQTWDLAPL